MRIRGEKNMKIEIKNLNGSMDLHLPEEVTIEEMYESVCYHLKNFIRSLEPLEMELNDGYSDWIKCKEHQMGIRLDNVTLGDRQDMKFVTVVFLKEAPNYKYYYKYEWETCTFKRDD